MSKKDSIPPFEIMRRPPGAPAGTAPPQEPAAPASGSGTGARPGGGAPWWVGSSSPIVLRIPRGLALVICLAILGLIVLAYGVGYVKGNGDLNNSVEDELVEIARRGMPAPDTRGSTQILGREAPSKPENGGPASSEPADPRTPGHNYMILATLKPKDAMPLIGFLRGNGVETILVSVRVRDSEQVQVVAVNKGFAGPDLNSQGRWDYESRLKTLGRAWKRHNGNRGDALGSMYFQKYTPPSEDEG